MRPKQVISWPNFITRRRRRRRHAYTNGWASTYTHAHTIILFLIKYRKQAYNDENGPKTCYIYLDVIICK